MPIILRPWGDASMTDAQIWPDGPLPQTIDGLDAGDWEVGRVVWATEPVTVAPSPTGPALETPPNLFAAALSQFDSNAGIQLRNNWSVQSGRLICTGTTAGTDARIDFDVPLTAGNPHYVIADLEITAGTLQYQLAAAGEFANVRNTGVNWNWADFAYFDETRSDAAFTRLQIKPSGAFAGSIDDLAIYDLSSTDPTRVPCDVVFVIGDSLMTSTTSDVVSPANRETAFDPRVWAMPSLLKQSGQAHAASQQARFVPVPAREPVMGTLAGPKMTPICAMADRLADWSAARGRPLLIVSLGDSGSGLYGTAGIWYKDRPSDGPNGEQMYTEMLDAKAAVEALGPEHEIIGVVASIGTNDMFGGDYAVSGGWLDQFDDFIADLRTDLADVPVALLQVGGHYEPNNPSTGGPDGRGANMIAAQALLDQDSGDARAIDRLRVVTPEPGHEIQPGVSTDPHFNAAGMQANGRDLGDALLAMLT